MHIKGEVQREINKHGKLFELFLKQTCVVNKTKKKSTNQSLGKTGKVIS
jgi:hypothetical protein